LTLTTSGQTLVCRNGKYAWPISTDAPALPAVVGLHALLGIHHSHKQLAIPMLKRQHVERIQFHSPVQLFHSINSHQQFLMAQ
ncbi:MAG: hypothetical protein EBQ63_04970, partial [Actinobacteria bacterium]|nr:hypothetical protein [Actinomycetota bacterium]